ncbi:hypothetical protein LPB86_20265 [Pedobacter sp. MC2016-14]|uniref:hypothetical protein n=1 Tax=Pedobacter sp. MC2016-14 TaxID=2897327 RepID=UPI001E485470|nr:hypothetical protein [Pedobacter sp. MC2016-14]MCD0490586.1 hypothetical protein [Pedobacter sp. MC2016-14]
MAKEIKVLKCPQCGSTAKTELKPDFFRCNNCQTEYYLDNDDVTINYNHNYNHRNTPAFDEGNKKTVRIVSVLAGVFIMVIVIFNVLSGLLSSRPSVSTNNTVSESEDKQEEIFSNSRYNALPFLKPGDSKPTILVVEDRSYHSDPTKTRNGIYLTFYDVELKKLGEEKIGDDDMSGTDVKWRTFSDGNIYIVADKTKLLKLDQSTLKVSDAGKAFFSAMPELQVGVATMEFVYEEKGDGLVLFTNDGQTLYYYPLVKKLYSKDAFYEAVVSPGSLGKEAKTKTIHLFTSASDDFPGELRQLIQVTYKDNGPGPKDVIENARWHKNYGGSGIFTDRSPFLKELIGNDDEQDGRIISWKDLTPGRKYFAPKVLLNNGNSVLISINADANPASPAKIQQLNSGTGAIEWTTDLKKGESVDQMFAYKGGYLAVMNSNTFMTLDANGKVTSTKKLE